MRTYWIALTLLGIVWISAMVFVPSEASTLPWRLAGSALFFAAFFLVPLARNKPRLLTILLSAAGAAAVSALWPEEQGTANPYALLVLSILAGKAAFRLPGTHACIVGGVLVIGSLAPAIAGYPSFPPVFLAMYAALHAFALAVYRNVWHRATSAEARSEALLSEYRKMKRRNASAEETARQEERAQVGRDIHDSVGHKLTALTMQLEVLRMQADADSEAQVRSLRDLARESLEETRNAVKALRNDEPGGLSSVLRLIRKLEAESLIRVYFTVKHGALSAPLTNDQSIAVYRCVQEALTNVMKHGKIREADVMFEAPGGSVFRFEISNPAGAADRYREGFGLRSMRERLENGRGRLEVVANRDRFTVRGTIPLNEAAAQGGTSG